MIKMTYTLDYLNKHQNEPLSFTLDFKNEAKELVMVEDIDTCFVKGTYSFSHSQYLNFELDVKAEITMLASDTLKPIKYIVEFKLIDEVSNTTKTEFQIKNFEIDFYELVWGWFITEIPYGVYEKD